MSKNLAQKETLVPLPFRWVGTTDRSQSGKGLYDHLATISGSSAIEICPSTNQDVERDGIYFDNLSGSYEVFWKILPRGLPAPTISTTDRHGKIIVGGERWFEVGPELALWVVNDTGAGTTSSARGLEMRRG